MPVPLIRTKLQRPQLPGDLVLRQRLLDRLRAGLSRKLTLISAQAGAGKSTLMAQWLADVARQYHSTWLSLDEHDNDLVVFVSYLIGAVQTAVPGACEETLGLLGAAQTPPLRLISTSLTRELADLAGAISGDGSPSADPSKHGLILALDDYQFITEPAIHELMSDLIQHLPREVHVALASRMDPPLPLSRLRARREMTEIRFIDLRFTPGEAHTFLQGAFDREVSAEAADLLVEKVEGWVVGLRLAALTVRMLDDEEVVEEPFWSGSGALIADYMLHEVLAAQSPEIQDFLLRISILDRFCAPLCEAVTGIPAARSQEIVDWVARSNLFLVPLDAEGMWYRYHQLFRDLLRTRLERHYGASAVATLHIHAGVWYAEHELIDEAIDHLLAADNVTAAADVVAWHRAEMMNQARWALLNRWVSRFPSDVLDQYPELLMLKTWLLYHQARYAELPAWLKRVEASLVRVPLAPDTPDELQGEMDALRSMVAYRTGDAEAAIVHARSSLERTRSDLWIVRSLARLMLALALQMKGDLRGAYAAIHEGFVQEEVSTPEFMATLLLTLCNVHWIAGDLQGLARAAGGCIARSQGAASPQVGNFCHYHLGSARYQQNDLASADQCFSTACRQPYRSYGNAALYGACGLGLTRQAQGRPDEAWEAAESAVDIVLETGNTTHLAEAQAFQAEVALMQGKLSIASRWAAQFDPVPPLSPAYGFFSPHLTLAKVWLAQNTPASRGQAADLLSRLQAFFTSTHNVRFSIETLALQALLSSAEGDEPVALTALREAVALAEPGGFIRLFVDLGPSMACLLEQLRRQRVTPRYIARILVAFGEEDILVGTGGRKMRIQDAVLVEPLTSRELEVLSLLAKHRTNRQIAEELFISPGTVKTHTLRIYRKLDVRGRQQAVAKARELDILPVAGI